MAKSALKFLITPNYAAPYDQRMVKGLADGLNAIGHQALALSAPISSREVAIQSKKHSIDIILQVNRTRSPNVELPKNIRYISWYQDVFPETVKGFAESFRESDILYALGDPKVLGLEADIPCYVGCLLSGVDQSIFKHINPKGHEKIDFSLCGFIPPPLPSNKSFLRYLLLGNVKYNRSEIMIKTVEENYCPLNGSLDINALELAIRTNMAPYLNRWSDVKQHLLKKLAGLRQLINLKKVTNAHLLSPYEKSISYFTREYPRLLDRVTLIDKVLKVSDSLELYGPGWERHKKYNKYSKGVISTQDGLLDTYSKSRINLANNTHGLGLHSRTLECMAVGGFIFTHDSPHDDKPGGMLTSFDPDKHFGLFNLENFHEEAERWLSENKSRMEAGKQASAIVRQQHCWHHRAQQISNDLLQ